MIYTMNKMVVLEYLKKHEVNNLDKVFVTQSQMEAIGYVKKNV